MEWSKEIQMLMPSHVLHALLVHSMDLAGILLTQDGHAVKLYLLSYDKIYYSNKAQKIYYEKNGKKPQTVNPTEVPWATLQASQSIFFINYY